MVRLHKALPKVANGNPRLDLLPTYGLADFSSLVAWYFTKERDMAELYAGYALERGSKGEEAAILTIAIDGALLAAQVPVEGDLWRQYVWSNRLHDEIAPFDAVAHLDDAPLLVGPILSKATKAVGKHLEQGDSYTCLRPATFPSGNSTRSQHVVKNLPTINEWSRHSNVWLESKGKI